MSPRAKELFIMTAIIDRLATEFVNTPLLDYSNPDVARRQREAIESVRGKLGRTYPLIIGGERVSSDATFNSINPAEPDQVVGVFPRASVDHARQAIAAAQKAFATWQYVDPAR